MFTSKMTFFEKEQLLEFHMFLTPTSFHHSQPIPCVVAPAPEFRCAQTGCTCCYSEYTDQHRLFTFGPTPSLNSKVSFKDKTSILTTCLSACTYSMRLNSPCQGQGQGQGLKAAPGIPVAPWISVDRPALSNQL